MKTSIIPIFIPHIGCPHRCVFCNQWQITGHHGLPSAGAIRELIQGYTASAGEGRHWEVAFYGGSFTAIPMEMQKNCSGRLMKLSKKDLFRAFAVRRGRTASAKIF